MNIWRYIHFCLIHILNLVRIGAWNFKIVATTIRKLSNDSSRTNKKKERNWNCLVGFCSSSTFQGFLQVHSICLCWRRLLLRAMEWNPFWGRILFLIVSPLRVSKSHLKRTQMEGTCKKPWNILLEQKPTRQFWFISLCTCDLRRCFFNFDINTLGVSPSLVSRWREAYSFWGISGP